MIRQPEWVYFDVETGGFDRKKHPLLQIGWALLDSTLEPLTGDSFHIIPDPGFEVDPEAAKANGYSPEAWTANEAIPLLEAREHVMEMVGPYAALPKLAHNAFSMDKPWIEMYFPLISPEGARWYCTQAQYRRYYKAKGLKPGKGDLTLESLAKAAGYTRINAHNALEDCYAGAYGARWLVSQGIPVA